MKIITCNVNGIRSAIRKGFFEWLATQRADFICLQETKAQLNSGLLSEINLPDYTFYASDAVKPGYSGVAIFTREKPLNVTTTLGWSCADNEGRFVQLTYPHVIVISLYLPSGTSGDHRQSEKYDFMKRFTPVLQQLQKTKKPVIICGDWNIAHKPIDLKNWRANQKHSGFLPDERAWLDKVFDELNWVDAFRVINTEADQYTWWSNRGQAWAKNVGWRIDYHIVTPDLRNVIKSAAIYKDQRFSDHAPLIITYDLGANGSVAKLMLQ